MAERKSKKALVNDKILNLTDLAHLREGWRVKGEKIVFTNGCFDILHRGHIELLLDAAALGNKLIVAINTDNSVRKLKGEGRPVNDEQSRALLLASQLYVDAVVLFDEPTPLNVIQTLKPDVIVKGGDYTPETVVGSEFVKEYGGETVIVPIVEGFSTTETIAKIKK